MTVIFDDVSHYQGAFVPSRLTIAKATQGTGFIDSEYQGIKNRALAKKLGFVGYHFLETGNIVAQAKFAYAHIGKTPAEVDVEEYDVNGVVHWPTIPETMGFINEFRSLGGIMRVSYIPEWFWEKRWGSANLGQIAALVKNINSNYSSASDASVLAPFGGLSNFARQYTNAPHDMNRTPLTAAQLWTQFSGVTPTTAHPPGSRELYLIAEPNTMVGADALYVQQHIKQVAFDSHYGPDTVSRMKWWQRQHGLKDDGRCGRNTWKTFGITMK